LFGAEVAIARTFAERAREGARRGDPVLREFVTEAIDLENLVTALLLPGSERTPAECFIDGGSRLRARLFERAAGAPDRAEAAALLRRGLGQGPLGLLLRHPDDLSGLEEAALQHRIDWLQTRASHDPLTSAPVLVYALRVRQEVIALQRIVWGLGLGAPPESLVPAEVGR
jgi:vacuolar-type H+-ATPase subunit C/Vma6